MYDQRIGAYQRGASTGPGSLALWSTPAYGGTCRPLFGIGAGDRNRVPAGCRSRYYSDLLQHRDMRGVLRALAKNRVVWYAPDVDAGSKRSVFAPFFGVPAASLTATSRLATVSGAPVVPCFYFRRADGSGYDIEVGPALDRFPSDEVMDDTARINRLIEAAVRRVPEQYFWQHRRFKSRPPGEPPVYRR
jgi:KDO2-lipid IV(A) lauroyltransferase